MNQQAKKSMIEFIDAILTFKSWNNTGEPLLFDENIHNKGKDIYDYFDDFSIYREMEDNNTFELLMDTLNIYNNSIDNDWLPNTIIGLPIPKAYLFLKEIKNIILTSEDKDIEDALIDARNKLLDNE